jgi:hypothetical protein
MFSSCFCFELFLSGVDLSFDSTMASSSGDKGKRPREEDPKLKEEQEAGRSRARNPTFEGPMKARHIFSHNMQGPILHVLDLNSMPVIKEGMLVTDEFCAQYRVLEKEVEILQEENLRLRRMLEYFINPSDEVIPITPPLSPAPIDDEDVATKKSNEIRIRPITRARAKLLEQ